MTLANKIKLLLVMIGLGLALLALTACGSDAETPETDGTGGSQQGTSANLANLLRSEIGASAYERLIQGDLGTSTSSDAGIWVSGRGEASAEPDLAILNLGVEAFATTVAEARSDAASAMGRILEVVKSSGIADRDIQTRFFNINARYTTKETTRCIATAELGEVMPEAETRRTVPPAPPEELELVPAHEPSEEVLGLELSRPKQGEECVVEYERVILGFDVTNQLTLKVRDLSSIGEIIDGTTEAGGDLARFQGVSFTIEDTKALQDQARTAAVEDLIAKATQVADLAGVELGRLVFITESGGPIVNQSVVIERAVFGASAAPSPIQAGELNVVVNVQGTFDIQRAES